MSKLRTIYFIVAWEQRFLLGGKGRSNSKGVFNKFSYIV